MIAIVSHTCYLTAGILNNIMILLYSVFCMQQSSYDILDNTAKVEVNNPFPVRSSLSAFPKIEMSLYPHFNSCSVIKTFRKESRRSSIL